MQQAERRRAKRNRLFMFLGSFVVVALVCTAVYVIVTSGKGNDQAKGGPPQFKQFAHSKSVITASRPKNVTEWAGITLGKGSGDRPTVGAVNEGKPTVTVYYDYLCHVCNDLESQVGGDLVKKAAAGEITLAYQPVSVVGDDFSKKAMQADYYVASKVPEKYVEFHKKFFSDISSSAIKNRKVPPVGDIVKLAKKAGLSSAQADELEKTLSGDAYGQLAEQANQQFQNDKLTGTPAVIGSWSTGLTASCRRCSPTCQRSRRPARRAPPPSSQTAASRAGGPRLDTVANPRGGPPFPGRASVGLGDPTGFWQDVSGPSQSAPP